MTKGQIVFMRFWHHLIVTMVCQCQCNTCKKIRKN